MRFSLNAAVILALGVFAVSAAPNPPPEIDPTITEGEAPTAEELALIRKHYGMSRAHIAKL